MITSKQRSNLRALSVNLKPLVNIGKSGLTAEVISEILDALFNHELIKISILNSCDLSAKDAMNIIAESLQCEAVQCIGKKLSVYKYSDKKDIKHIDIDF